MIPKIYIIGVLVVALALMSVALKKSYERNGELESKLETQAAETLECADANASNLQTIGTLRARIETMIGERVADRERREQVLVERDEELRRARLEADRLREERQDEIDSNVQCADFNSLVVAEFCPTTARRLRERSRGPDSGGDGDDSGAGGSLQGTAGDVGEPGAVSAIPTGELHR